MSNLRRTTAHELTDTAAGWALKDAADRRRDVTLPGFSWDRRKDPDFFEIACALRELGFVIIKREPNG